MRVQVWTSPARRPSAPPATGTETPPATGTSESLSVLIVEDNWLVSLELEAALIDAGHRVTAIAVSADEAVDACETLRPDLILMDIRLLGERDGIDAAIEARRRFDIPALFLSAHDDPHFRDRAADARPLGWLSKPITPDRVIVCLETLFAAHH